jgi:Putative transposase, YhgA-like
MQETTLATEENQDLIHHAADKGFKVMMKEKASALELMEKFVPDISKHLDMTSFELDDTNYVNKDFDEYYSDVVYRTHLKATLKKKRKPVAVALLFEHKKTIRSYFKLFLQLLEYMIFIWQADILNKRRPSIIIPIVIFQGNKGLRFKDLHSYFKDIPNELLQYIPNVKFHLTNVFDVPDQKLLDLNEKNLLRSLFLAYTFTDKKERVQKLLLEIFKFMKHDADKFDFFQLMFQFLSQEDVLNPDEINELFKQYLSPQQKQGVMNTYQILRQEGRQEKARLSVLRGKWNNWSAESLADMSELPLLEVGNLLKAYDEVYKLWTKNKGKTPDVLPKIAHLSEQEVSYLMVFFSQKHQVASEN